MCGAPGRPIVPSRGLRVYYARMLIPIAATAGAAALGAWAYGTYEPNSPLFGRAVGRGPTRERVAYLTFDDGPNPGATEPIDRKSTRLNSSHVANSYAVFCLKKKMLHQS